MGTILVDTYNLINTLRCSGFNEEQAGGISRALQELDLDHLATKGDLKALELATKADLKELELRMDMKLESKLDKLELRVTTRLAGIMMAGIAFLAAIKFWG